MPDLSNVAPPAEGERVLFCAHADVGEDHVDIASCPAQPFFWYYLGPNSVTGPDGVSFPVRWLAICNDCQSTSTPQTIGAKAAKDAKWIGEPPKIQKTGGMLWGF